MKKRIGSVCLALIWVTLGSCGGGGGGGGAGITLGTPAPTRGLEFLESLQFNQLNSPALPPFTGAPFLTKTLIGDLNGDGRNDIAFIAQPAVGGEDVAVLYQDQSGQFSTLVSFSLADLGLSAIRDIAIGDLNGDGRADLAVLGIAVPVTIGYAPPIAILYQDANGNLGTPVPVSVVLNGLTQLGGLRFAIGDVNGDGKDDIVTNGNGITILLQNPDGSIGTGPGSTFSLNAFPFPALAEVHIGDMNNDGLNDVVYQTLNTSLGVLKQTSPGVFATTPDIYPVPLTFATFYNTFKVGDLNGDGKADVVVLDPGNDGFLNIFLQNSAGTLDVGPRVPITSSPLYGIEIADIDGDGLNDILGNVVDPGFPHGVGQIHVFYQKPDHSFDPSKVYTFPTSTGGGSQSYQSLSAGDLDGDGRPDAAVTWADEGLFILMNRLQ